MWKPSIIERMANISLIVFMLVKCWNNILEILGQINTLLN